MYTLFGNRNINRRSGLDTNLSRLAMGPHVVVIAKALLLVKAWMLAKTTGKPDPCRWRCMHLTSTARSNVASDLCSHNWGGGGRLDGLRRGRRVVVRSRICSWDGEQIADCVWIVSPPDGEMHIVAVQPLHGPPAGPEILNIPADLLDGSLEDEFEMSEHAPGGRCRMPFCEVAATYGFCHADTAIVHGSCKQHTILCLDRGTCPYCKTGYRNIVKIITA